MIVRIYSARRLLPMLAICSLVINACIPLPHGYTVSRKTVATKEGDATLVAVDGTRCTVPSNTFVEVKPGDDHTCAWKDVDETGRTPARSPEPSIPRSSPAPSRPPSR